MKIAKLLPGLLAITLLGSYNVDIPEAYASSQVAMVKSVGEAIAMGDKAKDNALENAKQKAVKKAASRFIVPSEAADSLYQKLVADYRKYIRGDVKVFSTKKINGKLVLYCDVAVDYGDIQEDLNKKVSNYQNSDKNFADSAIFLVRIVGLPQMGGAESRLPVRVLNDYGMAFANYGFASYGSDAGGNAYEIMADTAKGIGQDSYLDYRKAILKDLLQDVSVTYAVVGEIRIDKLTSNATGEYAEASCFVEVVRPNANSTDIEVVGQFNDQYTASARNQEEAVAIVCKEAAVNSSKVLADITYKYWQDHK